MVTLIVASPTPCLVVVRISTSSMHGSRDDEFSLLFSYDDQRPRSYLHWTISNRKKIIYGAAYNHAQKWAIFRATFTIDRNRQAEFNLTCMKCLSRARHDPDSKLRYASVNHSYIVKY